MDPLRGVVDILEQRVNRVVSVEVMVHRVKLHNPQCVIHNCGVVAMLCADADNISVRLDVNRRQNGICRAQVNAHAQIIVLLSVDNHGKILLYSSLTSFSRGLAI